MKMLASDIVKAAKSQAKTVNVGIVLAALYVVIASSAQIAEKCQSNMHTIAQSYGEKNE